MARANSARKSGDNGRDAIALLKADHRRVEDLFEIFENSQDDAERQQLATQICTALRNHTILEEEIFYPAFLQATDDTELHHEAAIEHDNAKKLIAEIEASSPDDDYFGPRISVLSEMIRHHVKEEEKSGGMFAEARSSEMDLLSLGERLAARKAELEAGEGDEGQGTLPPGGDKEHGQAGRLMGGTR